MPQNHCTRRLRRARATAKAARFDIRPIARLAVSLSMLAALLIAFRPLG